MTDTVGSVDLLSKITIDMTLPSGYDQWGIRSVRADFTSSRGYRWPYPGKVAKASGPFVKGNPFGCPEHVGDGICLAKNWSGMASGGISASGALLLCAYRSADVLGSEEEGSKVRVTRCKVVELIDGSRLLRDRGASADLRSANLRSANLRSANLTSANLTSANLTYADLTYADLTYADLRSANLTSANLTSANLTYADLRSADLTYADLTSANLTYADLRFADLTSANLTSADLTYADLTSANLTYADLTYADLTSANLTSANLRSAPFGNEYTRLPSGWKIQKGLVVPDSTPDR